MSAARRRWFAVATAFAGGAAYWVICGLIWSAPGVTTFVFWHPAMAAFLGSAWGAVQAFVALDTADESCASCKRLEADLTETRKALATWKESP